MIMWCEEAGCHRLAIGRAVVEMRTGEVVVLWPRLDELEPWYRAKGRFEAVGDLRRLAAADVPRAVRTACEAVAERLDAVEAICGAMGRRFSSPC